MIFLRARTASINSLQAERSALVWDKQIHKTVMKSRVRNRTHGSVRGRGSCPSYSTVSTPIKRTKLIIITCAGKLVDWFLFVSWSLRTRRI